MIGLSGLSGLSALLPGAADVGAPTISSALIAEKDTADEVLVTFSERVRSPGDTPEAGWSCVVGAGAQRETATIVGTITPGTPQVETAVAVGTATAGGNITVTVTGALVGSSPKSILVAIANLDTPTLWAAKVRTALDVADITTNYVVGGADANISLTAKVAAADDVTLNIEIVDTDTTGITADASSADTTPGVAPGTGTVTVVVTADGMINSPKTLNIAVVAGDTAAQVAGKIRTALQSDANIGHASTGFFTVTGEDADVVLTAKVVAADDTTMNIAFTNGTCTGLTPDASSTNTQVGGAARAISGAVLAADWGSLTLTLASAVSAGEAVRLAYDANTGDLADVAGNVLATVASQVVTNSVDETPPTVSTAVVAAGAANIVTLTFDEVVASPGDDASAGWSVTVGGAPAPIDDFVHIGDTLGLLLLTPVANGDVVKVIYDAGTGDLVDAQGNALASIVAPGSAVTNNVPDTTAPMIMSAVIANAAPTKLVLTFSEDIISATPDYLAGWVVKKEVGQVAVAVGVASGARLGDHTKIELTLSVAAVAGEIYGVGYAADQADIVDLADNVLASFTGQLVSNNVL